MDYSTDRYFLTELDEILAHQDSDMFVELGDVIYAIKEDMSEHGE